jgi:hypothetical protein
MTNQGGGSAIVAGPTLSDGTMNEFRTLDPPVDLTPIQIPVTLNQQFLVSLKFLNANSGSAFAPSVVFDTDTCQPGLNTVDAVPGGWNDACVLGVQGDWVIRAVIACEDVEVPAASHSGHAAPVAALALLGLLAVDTARRARATR